MVDQVDDSYSLSIAKIFVEGNLDIIYATAPTEAEPGTFFDIEIGITNWGGDDSCFVVLNDIDFAVSIMRATFDAPGYSSFTITLQGIQMENRDMNLLIEAGHIV